MLTLSAHQNGLRSLRRVRAGGRGTLSRKMRRVITQEKLNYDDINGIQIAGKSIERGHKILFTTDNWRPDKVTAGCRL